VPHPVAEAASQHLGVIGEPAHYGAVGPAALGLQRGRQIPVIDREPGLQLALQAGIDEALVVVQPAAVHEASAFGQHPRPGHRKAKVTQPQRLGQVEVGLVAVEKVAAHPRVLTPRDGPRPPRELVPDARPLALLLPATLHLIRRASRPPVKISPEIGSGKQSRRGLRKKSSRQRGLVISG